MTPTEDGDQRQAVADGPARPAAGALVAAVRRPAVPVDLRRATAVAAALALLVLAVLGVVLHGTQGPAGVDRVVSGAVRQVWPEAGLAAYLIDGIASPRTAALIAAALAVACVVLRRWRLAVVAAVGPLSSGASASLVKPLVDRTIHGDNLAFPSGHTAFATAVALLLGLILTALVRPARAVAVVLLAVVTTLLGAGMALDQVIVNAHYPTDTVGGFATAIVVVSVVALLTDALAEAWLRSAGRAEP